MTLEQIIKIQQQLGKEFVTPLVLDYLNIKDYLYNRGYKDEILQDMSIIELKCKYIHNKLNKCVEY